MCFDIHVWISPLNVVFIFFIGLMNTGKYICAREKWSGGHTTVSSILQYREHSNTVHIYTMQIVSMLNSCRH